jgi:hypothetical protein
MPARQVKGRKMRLLLAFGAAAIASTGTACAPAQQHSSAIPPQLVTPNAPTQALPAYAHPAAPPAQRSSSIPPGPNQPPPAYALPAAPPTPQRGSSTPPAPNQPLLVTPNALQAPPTYALPPAPPPAREPGGRIVQSPSGLGVTSGGTQGYQTMTTPGGGSAIIVPSGGGTSTVIHSGGLIETVPTPR